MSISAALALSAVLAATPQDPFADAVQEVEQQAGLDAAAADSHARIAAPERAQVKAVKSPAFVGAVRAAGAAAMDQQTSMLSPDDEAELLDRLFTAVRAGQGIKGRGPKVPLRPSIDDFVKTTEHAWRDLFRALGSGRRLYDVAAHMLTAVDSIREERANLEGFGKQDAKVLAERFERAGDVDLPTVLNWTEEIVRLAVALDRDDLREEWRRKETRSPRSDHVVQGDVLIDRDTAAGRLVVGGFGKNSYDCAQIAILIDLGGDDEYRGAAGGAGEERELAVVVDLGGNDRYEAMGEALGSAIFGIGVLVDVAGDDTYEATVRAAGFGSAGVGAFLDLAGDDTYRLGDQCGGVGLAGIGLFLDAAGNDDQRAGVQSFGVGLPGGLGLAWDAAGNDQRELGRVRKQLADAASTTSSGEGQEVSVGLGVGIGILPVLDGGAGVFIDSMGDDDYRTAGLALGVGIRGGVGLFRDDAGQDRYQGQDGVLGVGYAHGIGLFVDAGGHDGYQARRLAYGCGEASGYGAFHDLGGGDAYGGTWPALGAARRGGAGAFVDGGGLDTYVFSSGTTDWRLVATDESKGRAVGVFLDVGTEEDRFAFTGRAKPEPGVLSIESSGEGDAREDHLMLREH